MREAFSDLKYIGFALLAVLLSIGFLAVIQGLGTTAFFWQALIASISSVLVWVLIKMFLNTEKIALATKK